MTTTPSTIEPNIDPARDAGSDTDLSTCTRTHADPTESTFASRTPLFADPSTPTEPGQVIGRPTEPPDGTDRTRPSSRRSVAQRTAWAIVDLLDMSVTPTHRALTSTDGGYRSARG